MPTFQNVRVALCNDHDAHGIPEFKDSSQGVQSSAFDVYAPIYHGSHLHVRYNILPPQPINSYFLFKLFVNGRHFVSWGAGPEDAYKGKVSFGLFDGGESERGHTIIEKKALAFSQAWRMDSDRRQGLLEVKVHRANARRRVIKELKPDEFLAEDEGSLSLLNVRSYGYLRKPEKQRYYEYALLDPKDSPFVNFRYHFMSLEQLEALAGLAEQDETPRNQSVGSSQEESDSRPGTVTPSSAQSKPEPLVGTGSEGEAFQHESPQETSSEISDLRRRISFPPRTRLSPVPSQGFLRGEFLIPRKPRAMQGAEPSLVRSTIGHHLDQLTAKTQLCGSPGAPTASETPDNSEGEPTARNQKSRVMAARGLKGIVANAIRRKGNNVDEKAVTG